MLKIELEIKINQKFFADHHLFIVVYSDLYLIWVFLLDFFIRYQSLDILLKHWDCCKCWNDHCLFFASCDVFKLKDEICIFIDDMIDLPSAGDRSLSPKLLGRRWFRVSPCLYGFYWFWFKISPYFFWFVLLPEKLNGALTKVAYLAYDSIELLVVLGVDF